MKWTDLRRVERSKRLRAAQAFVEAVLSGNSDAFYDAVDGVSNVVDGWAVAIAKAAKLQQVSPEIQDAFLAVWTESKVFSLMAGKHRTLAMALRVLLPRTEIAAPRVLFRGAAASEARRRQYGFSWSIKREIAERFVEGKRPHPKGAVLLETLAPPEAVLHVRENIDGYCQEDEYIVDPYRLGRVRVIAQYPSSMPK